MKRHSPKERRERKQRVLSQGTPSVTARIADAVVIKDGNVFFLSTPQGNVPCTPGHGFGLYYHDCRYLDGYELEVGGEPLEALGVDARRGFRAVFQLTNPDLRKPDGELLIAKEKLGVQWKRVMDARAQALHERLRITNYGARRVDLPLELRFRAGFQDVFEVRGLLPDEHANASGPRWEDGRLRFSFVGLDGVTRRLCVHFSPTPRSRRRSAAGFRLRLAGRETTEIGVSLHVEESVQPDGCGRQKPVEAIERELERTEGRWLGSETGVSTDSLTLDAILERSLRDLRMLRNTLHGEAYIAAGVPWYGALFGRDSVLAALQTLAFDPRLAEQTLRLLARMQGTRVDEHRDEQPGKILHELRVGELAAAGEIPHSPYYGTVDATPLFLILLERHAAWAGDLELFRSLAPQVELALKWIDRYGDADADGYVEYHSHADEGLVNQGWKDSGDAVVRADGALARPPIALVEVQAYVFRAKRALARLYERAGDAERARRLHREAAALRRRFNRDFWFEDEGLFDLALQADKSRTRVATSNAGHALWSGIAEPHKARRTAKRLMEEDLFSGWGVRTLSSRSRSYNPLGYHLGTVWPHDNALIAAGMRRYGMDEDACRIFEGLLQAARHFEAHRLPELFGGFSRREYEVPVPYPVACHPQAWAAGAIPYLLKTLLGLVPDGFAGELRIVRPVLPGFVDRLELHGLRVGTGSADLAFRREKSGRLAVRVLRADGKLDVRCE
jgi:glycogen debranching enzyme